MKICILSMQHVPNLGSVLQSYSLKKLLDNQNNTVSFIDIERNNKDNKLLDESIIYETDSEGKTGVIGKLKKIDKYFINRILIKEKAKRQRVEFDKFRNDYLYSSSYNKDAKYELCVIGSDEVFNCMAKSPWGFTSQLFGNVPQAKKVITYAASCGSTKYSMLPVKVAKKIEQSFLNIDGFSVRDLNTFDFVQHLTKQEIMQHMDPVVVGDFDEEIMGVNLPDNMPKHYCIVYSYYNRIHSVDEIKSIKQFCKNNKLEIITIGAPQKWCRNHMVLDPFQALLAFKRADFVVTDTFHGTVFSAKYSDRFAVIPRQSNQNKLIDLVERLDIKKHLVKNIHEIVLENRFFNDKGNIEKIIEVERNRTIKYLEKYIL